MDNISLPGLSNCYLIVLRFWDEMKKIITLCVLLSMIISSLAQTFYYPDSTPIVNGKESIRLYSLEIIDGHLIATIEITALKHRKRINFWMSKCTVLRCDEEYFKICDLAGFYINGRIEKCGYEHPMVWHNVAKGEKKYVKLYFGYIPSGTKTISIKDYGEPFFNGRSLTTIQSYNFEHFPVNFPRTNYSSIDSDSLAKINIDINNDGICGIYELLDFNQTTWERFHPGEKLACIKEDGSYKLIHLDKDSRTPSIWQGGDIKAEMTRSASGIFKAILYKVMKIGESVSITFDGVSMTINIPSGEDPGVVKFLKMYPINSAGIQGGTTDKYGQEWSGSGFALNNGYIITNNHVVDGAKSIVVLGVNGNFTTEFNACVESVDKNNDLALVKINDSRFKGFDSVPYAVSNRICEVGEDVFVLGYPLTSVMGDEIKLTNGIISSRSGFQGDMATYQISAPVQPGNSGGPLFDSQGNVVGIVNAGIPGAENVGYAIKTSYLYNLVGSTVSTSIIPQTNKVQGTSLADKVKSVKKCVLYIKCKGN